MIKKIFTFFTMAVQPQIADENIATCRQGSRLFFTLTSFVMMTLLLGGCMVISIGGGNIATIDVRGVGEITSHTFDTEDFNAVHVGSNFIVSYRHANRSSITVTMQENLFEYLEVSVQDGTINVGPRGFFNTNNTHQNTYNFDTTNANRPRIYIYAPYLHSASFSGTVDVGAWDAIHTQDFTINIAGTANLAVPLDVVSLDVAVAGASNLELLGTADTVNISVSGAGDISAFDLQAKNVEISMSGTGNVDISASDSLDITLSGVGRVRYIGSPTVTQQISGLGSVERHR